MKVSVIVPTRNRAGMVGETVAAILNQTFRDLELIVVDDCSEDNTEAVIKAFNDSRLRYFKHDSGRLVAVNRNFGMSQASGDFIAFCDDDDVWFPEKLERQLRAFTDDDALGLVCTNAVIFDETGGLGDFHRPGLPAAGFTLNSLLRVNPIICSSVLVKKSVIDDVGGMNTGPVFRTGQDYELWLRVARKYRIKYIDLPLLKYRVHSRHLKPVGVASAKHRREIYRWLLGTGFISRGLYWRLILRSLAIELLLRTRTMTLASRLWRFMRR